MSSRNLALYNQGRESRVRKQRAAYQAQSLREQAEMDQCPFIPTIYTHTRTVRTEPPRPRLFEKAVERIRHGAAARACLDALLTPRVPMQPRVSSAASVTVEVTKDGADGNPTPVGTFVLHRGSDPSKIASLFARANRLSVQQETRLQEQLELGMKGSGLMTA